MQLVVNPADAGEDHVFAQRYIQRVVVIQEFQGAEVFRKGRGIFGLPFIPQAGGSGHTFCDFSVFLQDREQVHTGFFPERRLLQGNCDNAALQPDRFL